MIARQISCGRTHSLDKFEFVKMEVTADLEEGEDPTEAMRELYDYVDTLVQMDIDEIRLAKAMQK